MRSITGFLILVIFSLRPVLSQDVIEPAEEVVVAEEEEVVMEVAAAGFAPAPNPADIIDQLRPLMNIELGFLKRVCDPTDEQKRKIAAAAEECLQGMNDIVGAKRNNPFGGDLGGGGGAVVVMAANGQQLNENPFTRIRRDLREAVRPLLSEQQFEEYVTEAEKRERFQREAVVGITIELIDRHLVLSDDQRAKVMERLLENWQGAENLAIETYVHNPQYVPPVPEALVQRELNDAQLRVWKSLSKAQFPFQLPDGLQGVWDEEFLE